MITLKNIKKVYKTRNMMHVALNNINLSFNKSDFVAILGPSGSGKTTLLNIIGGLDCYTQGELIINGKSTKYFKDYNWDSYRNSCIGFIFQGYNLIEHITVYKNVELSLTLNGIKNKKELVLKALKKVGLQNHVYKKIRELSGGQMQRVAIARALVNDPDIILADEPTGALDSKTSVQIMEIIKEISKDKLVIMVTHNDDLANKYSNRIIKLCDGNVVSDTNPLSNIKSKNKFKIKRTKMNYLTAISLSLNNLKSKKGRTILTSFASSIGIVGIALVLSISNGFKKQIEDYEKNTMSSFPIIITDMVSNIDEPQVRSDDKEEYSNNDALYSYNSKQNNKVHENKITSDYIDYINKINHDYVSAISYYRLNCFNVISNSGNDYNVFNSSIINFIELPVDLGKESYLKDNYDLLAGTYPKSETDVVLMVDSKNRIDDEVLNMLYVNKDKKKINFKDIVGKEFKLINNNDYYKNIGNNIFIENKASKELYDNANNIKLKITGIVRGKKDNELDFIMNSFTESNETNNVSKIGYSNALLNKVINNNKESDIVKVQKNIDKLAFMGGISFEQAGITKEKALSMLCANDVPIMMYIYPENFESKNKIIEYLDMYNENKNEFDKIIYTDYASEIVGLSNSIMDGITIVLVAFSSISLIVSSVMIGIITYISVLERTKEIGILRSLGARKKDIIRVFNSETLIIGALSGLFGIVATWIMLFPVNNILYNLTDLKNLAVFSLNHAIILIIFNIVLTLIGGYIPAKVASKKNPVEAFRNE